MPEFRTVLRPIPGPSGLLESGSVVDVSGWRNTKALVNMGRLGDVVEAPVKKVRKTSSVAREVAQEL